ncbi:MAG: tetratricopeptide repeat protein [Pirellulaceae bacterium]
MTRWGCGNCVTQAARQPAVIGADSFKRLGEALHQTKNYTEAATYLSKAAGLAPEDAAIHHQWGLSLQAAGDNAGAAVAYKKSLELNPDLAPAHNNLAIVLAEQGHNEEAVKHYEQALDMNSKLFQTKCNLGGLLRKMGRLEESIEWLQSAVEQKSDCAEALCNLGNTYGDMGESQSAMECYRKAILCQADYTQARLNRAIGLLRREEFSEGWMEYEWRWKLKECPRRNFGKPRWDGRELNENEVLLVHAEQGLGDTLQMVRYIKQLKSRGTRIVLECQKALVPFLTLNEVADTVLPIGDKYPEYDFHIPLMSLPSLLFDKLGFASDNVPYLRAAMNSASIGNIACTISQAAKSGSFGKAIRNSSRTSFAPYHLRPIAAGKNSRRANDIVAKGHRHRASCKIFSSGRTALF